MRRAIGMIPDVNLKHFISEPRSNADGKNCWRNGKITQLSLKPKCFVIKDSSHENNRPDGINEECVYGG
jgi:hypothetical protein